MMAEEIYDSISRGYPYGYEDGYEKGSKDAIKRMLLRMDKLWKAYESDPDNVPKPDFMSAYALISGMDDNEKGENQW